MTKTPAKNYKDFGMTGLPDSPVIRKAHDLLIRTLDRQYNSESIEPVVRDDDPGFDDQFGDSGYYDDDINEQAMMHVKTSAPVLAQLSLESAVETARIVYANSAMDNENLVAAALLLDCVEDEQAIDDLISEIDEAAGIPVLELDQVAPDTDSPLEAADQLSDAAKILVLAHSVQAMTAMSNEFERRENGPEDNDGDWHLSLDRVGEWAEDMYQIGKVFGGIDAGLDHAFDEAKSELAGRILDDHRKFFAETRNRIKKAASALKA